jgi:hypothetical protein
MKAALVIFNGIQFSYYQVDRAIEWTEKNEAQLHGLFVFSDKEPPEGYIFPSDIDPAENLYNKKDAERNNEKIIVGQIKLFTDMARTKGISVITEQLLNPSLKKILEMTESSEILFVDEKYDKALLLACTSFKLKDLVKQSKCQVEMVHDKKLFG